MIKGLSLRWSILSKVLGSFALAFSIEYRAGVRKVWLRTWSVCRTRLNIWASFCGSMGGSSSPLSELSSGLGSSGSSGLGSSGLSSGSSLGGGLAEELSSGGSQGDLVQKGVSLFGRGSSGGFSWVSGTVPKLVDLGQVDCRRDSLGD